MAYQGYLLKVGTSLVEVPTQYIEGTTYKVTPNQRMEWSAERDTTGALHRETVENKPPKIEFETIPRLTNTEIGNLMSILRNAYTDADERKLPINFYDPESDSYKTWDCYMPDIEFAISEIDNRNNIIYYEKIRLAFIGY